MTIGPETCYRVRGGIPLQGTVFVQGAKNAALKMIAASLLTAKGRTVLIIAHRLSTVRAADRIVTLWEVGAWKPHAKVPAQPQPVASSRSAPPARCQ